MLMDDIRAVFVCREGIGAAFGTSLVWLTGPEGLGVQTPLGLLGTCPCPARCPAEAGSTAQGCSRQAGDWQPARSPFSQEKPRSVTDPNKKSSSVPR